MPCGGFFCAVVGGNEGRGRCGRGWRETWQCAAVSAVAADDAVVEVGTVAAVAVVDVDDVGRNVAGRARPLVVVMSWEGVAVVGDVLPFLVLCGGVWLAAYMVYMYTAATRSRHGHVQTIYGRLYVCMVVLLSVAVFLVVTCCRCGGIGGTYAVCRCQVMRRAMCCHDSGPVLLVTFCHISPGRLPNRLHPEGVPIWLWWCSIGRMPTRLHVREGLPGIRTILYMGAAYMVRPGACPHTWFAIFSRHTYQFCKLRDSKIGTKQRKLHLKTKNFAEKFARGKISSYLCTIRKQLIGLDGFTDYL